MASSATRMLLLGAVSLFEPVNGYQIRRELVSWNVDGWAHLNPGSIYHGLTSLARDGLLVRHDLDDHGRAVAVYEMADAGRAELERLQLASLGSYDPYDRADFTAAIAMHSLRERDPVLAALDRRRAALAALVDQPVPAPSPYVPPVAHHGMALQHDFAAVELRWLDGLLAAVRRGELELGHEGDWAPPADDPGWQMAADSQRYRDLLGR